MGSFAGYSVSVSTFEIVRLFFNGIFSMAFSSALLNGFFFWCCDLMDCFFGPFFSTPEDLVQFALHIPFNFSSASRLPGCHFFGCDLVYSFGHQKTFFSMTNQKLFCFSRAWRRLVMSEEDSWCLKRPGEAFHTRRHRPRRRHQESRLVAPKTPIWLSHTHTHFAWQTKLWLSEDVSVRFNQNLLKQCTHKYYIRLSG